MKRRQKPEPAYLPDPLRRAWERLVQQRGAESRRKRREYARKWREARRQQNA